MTPELRAALHAIDRQFDAIRAMPTPIAATDRHRVGLTEVKAGGYIRLAGETYRVVERSRYDEKKSSWYELELFGLTSGEIQYIDWEQDDSVEVSLNGPPITLGAIGHSADEIEEMSDADEGEIQYAGRTYLYDDDYGAKFLRGEKGGGENCYFYDFETRDEEYVLTVEEWGDQESGYEYQVFISESVDPHAIEVLVTGDVG
jgi:hypothetical protein